jgi:hypothetical protein
MKITKELNQKKIKKENLNKNHIKNKFKRQKQKLMLRKLKMIY